MKMTTGFTEARIEQTLEVFRAFLRGDRREPLLTVHVPPAYRQARDPERIVEGACTQIRADASAGEPHVLPTYWPDFGTISTAKLWGGAIVPARDGGGIHIEPVVRTLGELDGLAVRESFEESDYGRAISLHRRICERLGSGRVFIRTPDLQGPMNTLALLMDQSELMCGMYEDPSLIAQALDRVTDVLIETVTRFRHTLGPSTVLGNIWPYVALPDGAGVGITQDYMPLLSPELYERFELPCLKRIADTFGGVYIHCCGRFSQHLPALARADFKIWGLEVHYPFTALWDAYAALGDRVVYTPYVAEGGVSGYASLAEFCGELRRRGCGRARYWFCASADAGDLATLRQAVEGLGDQHETE